MNPMDNPRASRGKRNGIGKKFRENYDLIDWGREKELLCGECGGTGGVDSGGMTPYGSGIDIPCPSCSPNSQH